MKIMRSRRLRGPNVYLSRPVLVARLRLDELAGRETSDIAGFTERLLRTLPGLAEHHCAKGAPGGFTSRLRAGTYFGHVTEHVAIELSQLIGRDVSFGRTVPVDEPGQYDVILECPRDEPAECAVPRGLLEAAVDLVTGVAAGEAVADARDERLSALRATFDREMPGPSTGSIIAAARRRGIPVERMGDLSLLRLGHGNRRRLAWAAMTEQTSAVAVDIAADKEVTRRLLADAGVPVPPGGAAKTVQEALDLLTILGPPVVVKPRHGRQGEHVYLDLGSADEVRAAFTAAGGEVVVERQLPGRDYRLLVVGGRVVAAAERIPAHVVGDGTSTVAELLALVNADPRRGAGYDRVLTRLHIDDLARAALDRQGCTLDTVAALAQTVWLRDNANLSTGGTSRDVTDRMHRDVADLCVRVANLVGLDIAGIDLRLPDIAAPLPPSTGAQTVTAGVIELNAAPGLRMHLAPDQGRRHDVGEAIVQALFPAGADGRIPTAAVTGTNGKTTVARLTAHLLEGGGLRVGLTTTDGVRIGGRMIQHADATGPRSAQLVLGDPAVQVAVLETARGGILRRGLGYDWTDVGVVTNITADHLGQDGLHTVEDVADVKAIVAERVRDGGTLVLNADDPWVRQIAGRPRVRAARKRLVWFSLQANNPVVGAHLAGGGTAYLLEEGWLVQAVGARRMRLLPVADLPGSFGGAAGYATANALAAAAAARSMGAPHDTVAERLLNFEPAAVNPGRGVLLRHGDVYLFVDYAHNPAALAEVTRTLHRLWGAERCVAAVTLPGDRRDDLLAASAQVVADGFSRIVLYDDDDLRGRMPGEVGALVRREVRARRPQARCEQAARMPEALHAALAMANPGDVVLVLYEKVEPVLTLLRDLGAEPAHAALVGAGARR
ncbi:MAG TPA: cyanophycin synthetase [Catenuloplanes sp.]